MIITSPKNDTVTTRGVVNVQGQAPLETVVTICVDMIGIEGECNDEQVVEVNENGFFTTIVPLATKESYIWATATDNSGNVTPKSNVVRVILDFTDPLVGVYVLPSLTGINQEVILRSIVTENTTNVRMKFADYTNLSELPDGEIDWYLIGDIDNSDDGDLDDKCDFSQCTWDYSWITPEVTGGVYEIKFTAKKGEKYQSLSLGIRIDGTIPVVPTILKLINQMTSDELRVYNHEFYTNVEDLEVFGVAEPLSNVHLLLDDGEVAMVKSDANGRWSSSLALPQFDYQKFALSAVSSDNVDNQSDISMPLSVVLDKVKPQFESLFTSQIYHRSGTAADVLVQSDEALFDAHLTRADDTEYSLQVGEGPQDFIGSFTIESDAQEGDYSIIVTIEDFAGNSSQQILGFVIDNTAPQTTMIDISQWGRWNGIEAKVDVPAKGRLVPEYVIRGRDLIISGKAEQYSAIEIWVDSYKIDEAIVSDNNCDGTTVAYADEHYALCDWNYSLTLGAFEKGYTVQTKVLDRAGNKSAVSDGVLLFYDNTIPKVPVEGYALDYWDDDGLGRITNKTEVNLAGEAEKLSDLETWLTGPNGFKRYYFSQTSAKSEWGQKIELGVEQGIGEDSIYNVTLQSTDAAGNRSELLNYSITRDTVPPVNPVVGEPYLCGEAICVKVSGEKDAKIVVNGRYIGRARSVETTYTLTGRWEYDRSYSYDIYLEDRARNKSGTVTRSIKTPPPPLGDADIRGATGSDPWSGQNGDSMAPITMDVSINSDGSYAVGNYNIPTPSLTKAITTLNGKVEIYGVGIPKYHSLSVNIRRTFMTYYEAVNACGASGILSGEEKQCIADKMGYSSYSEWSTELLKKCLVVNVACIEHEKQARRRIGTVADQRFKVQHVQVKFFNFDQQGKYIGDLWNDSAEGRFQKAVTLGQEVHVSELVKAQTVIFGDFDVDGIRIDYRGKNAESARRNEGLSSGISGGVKVDRQVDSYPDGLPFTGRYQLTGIPETHMQRPYKAALDIQIKQNEGWSNKDDAELYAIIDGYAKLEEADNKAWVVNIVSYDNEWMVSYAHVEYDTDRAKRVNISFPKNVKRGELIGYQGNTGYWNGVRVPEHLHYEVSKSNNGTFTNYNSIVQICTLTTIESDCNYRRTVGYPPIRYYQFK